MPEEQEGDLAFDYKWREMIRKTSQSPSGNTMITEIHPRLAVALYHDMIAEVYHSMLDSLHNGKDAESSVCNVTYRFLSSCLV